MADVAKILRDAVAAAAAKTLGLKTNQPTLTASNQHTPRAMAQIAGMPVDISDWKPLQVLDTGSSDFGKFYFYRAMMCRVILQRSSVVNHVSPGDLERPVVYRLRAFFAVAPQRSSDRNLL